MMDMSRRDVRKQIGSIIPAVFAALLAALVLTILPGGSARAIDDCIDAPNSQPPQGSHWYFRTDRTNQRKCWYLGPEGKKVQHVVPLVGPTAKSRAPLEAETAGDRLAPPMRIEQATTQTWRATAVGDTTRESASGVRWPDPSQSTVAVVPSAAAMRAPALEDHPTVTAQDTDLQEKAPAHRSSGALTEVAVSATVVPLSVLLRVLLLVGGALAVAGILLRAIFKIAVVRRRQVLVDQSDADWRISGHERMPPTFASRFPPPQPLVDPVDANNDFEETLRQMLRARERRAAWSKTCLIPARLTGPRRWNDRCRFT